MRRYTNNNNSDHLHYEIFFWGVGGGGGVISSLFRESKHQYLAKAGWKLRSLVKAAQNRVDINENYPQQKIRVLV